MVKMRGVLGQGAHHLCSQSAGEFAVHGVRQGRLGPRAIGGLKALLHLSEEAKGS